MRSIALAISAFVLNLAIQPPGTASAQSGQPSPDFDLAYVLATASYCAYTVGEADTDHGRARALRCLKAAAGQDRERLGVFSDIAQDDVEAFFDPNAPEHAYLLVWTKKAGVILAFRGTLTPPISPDGGFLTATAAAVAKAHEATLFTTFMGDWVNNFDLIPRPLNLIPTSGWPARGIRTGLVWTSGAFSGERTVLRVAASSSHSSANSTIHRRFGCSSPVTAKVVRSQHWPRSTFLGGDVPVVYTFAAAKALTVDGAIRHTDAVKNIWRFEHQYDIVPSVPPDQYGEPMAALYARGRPSLFCARRAAPIAELAEGGRRPPERSRKINRRRPEFASWSQFLDFTQLLNPGALLANAPALQ